MPQIIAGMYELQQKIGAGGGGVVYLGRHIRLDKPVVLKADKRTLNVGPETLRREVDLLKGLSHTYIPQVYDFVQEEGVVYTVMDYIQGESLDKLIAQDRRPGQAELVGWACQLLEALVYLHGRPPYGILHGDIKPANIMRRPNGDMCLIDFNIALALGEDGAVKVGFSRGYASPEHYGADYLVSHQAAAGTHSQFKNSSFFRGGRPEKKDSYPHSDSENPRSLEGRAESTLVLSEGAESTSALNVCAESTLVLSEGAGSISALNEGVESALVLNQGVESTLVLNERNGSPRLHAGNIAPSRAYGENASTGSTSGGRGIMLDVRSDVYSLGATLYHLISGKKPPQDAREVQPLGKDVCSAAISAILQKAMAPRPEDRYQTAQEMLTAFRQLHRQDIRAVKHRRRMAAWAVVLTFTFLAGGAGTFIGMKQLEQRQRALTLAEYSANALAEGDTTNAVGLALQAIPRPRGILDAPLTAHAQKALTDALGVYDLTDGYKALDAIGLPGAPFHIALSPEGTRLAVVYAYEAAVYDLATQRQIVALPVQQSALSDCVFVDEDHIVYAGNAGVTGYDLEKGQTVWTGEVATTLTLSADGQVVAAVDRDAEQVILYRTSDGVKLTERDFEGRHLHVPVNDIFADAGDDIFALNADGSLLAVSFHDGGLWILDMDDPQEDLILYEESDYSHFEGGFYGKYFAFSAEKSGEARFGIVDVEEAVFTGGYSSQDHLMVRGDESGIYLASGNLLVRIDPDTFDEREMAYTEDARITGFSVGPEHTLVAVEDGRFAFYDSAACKMSVEEGQQNSDFVVLSSGYAVAANRNEPSLRLMALEDHREARLASYDPRYIHDEARVSQDGQSVMLFGYEDFCIYDMGGNILAQGEFPDAEHIYDQQFRKSAEGSWLEVIWYDGMRRLYSAADGSVLSEEKGTPPEKDLYEEFITDRYRVASALHGAPVVYDLDTGLQVAVLEEDGYLTYVSQVGEYLITEYIATSGERYGLLLDQHMEKLAYLPGLCDVAGDMLIFDCGSGNLRQCRLYTIQELIALGEAYIEE